MGIFEMKEAQIAELRSIRKAALLSIEARCKTQKL
jgi:hypothetical protein